MKKRILIVLGLFLGTGAAFAQTPADSSRTSETPLAFPRFKFKGLPENYRLKRRTPEKNSQEALKQLATPKDTSPEDVTPFYSNMPMATFKVKPEPMPSAKADNPSVHHHLLQKRYKVMPIPSEEESVVK